eukprot:COSAG04_NODE_91_length_26852_cov_8.609315_30_plen_64_part_00
MLRLTPPQRLHWCRWPWLVVRTSSSVSCETHSKPSRATGIHVWPTEPESCLQSLQKQCCRLQG